MTAQKMPQVVKIMLPFLGVPKILHGSLNSDNLCYPYLYTIWSLGFRETSAEPSKTGHKETSPPNALNPKP